MKKNKIRLGKLFYNNKVVLVFALILSFVFWIKLSTSSSEISAITISDIPIAVNLSDSAKNSGLTVFGNEEITAQISVSGNRIILGQLSKNDILVTAQQASHIINTPGNYTLELSAKKNSLITDYEFVSGVSPSFITVVVDRVKTVTMNISENIKYTADTKYFVSTAAFSENTVTLTGPESQVAAVAKIVAEGEIAGILDRTTTINEVPLVLYDENDNKISGSNIKMSVKTVDATISILERKTLDLTADFTNTPEGFKFDSSNITISPKKIEVAAEKDIINNLKSINLPAIDFSQINPNNNRLEVPINLPAGCNNLSNEYLANIKLNTSGLSSKKISVNRVDFKNVPNNKSAYSHTLTLYIHAVGPENQIKNLKSENIYAVVDLAEKQDFVGRTEMPAKIMFISAPGCWAYGSYNINVGITNK